MSNVKETYESAFGPEGWQFTNLVLNTLSPNGIRDANGSGGVGGGLGHTFFTAGDYAIGKERIRLRYYDE